MTFLRPWLLLLLLIPFIFHIFRERGISASAWSKVIDPKLLPYLLVKGSNTTAKKRSLYKMILWSLFVIGLSGPAFHKITVPTQTSQPATIFILDLDPTMQGQNLKRAQQKIYDLLDALPQDQIGLILYDKYAYTAGPLTFDSDIIRQMVPFLDRSLLQEPDQNPLAAFEKADTLFKNAGVSKGRIIFLTTGDSLSPTLATDLKKYPHQIGILGIGSTIPQPVDLPEGGFLTDSSGHPKMLKLDSQKLSQIGSFQALTPDDTDIQNLIAELPTSSSSNRTLSETSFWQDSGFYFVLLALPFFAFFFRRGSAFIILLFLYLPAQADLWLRDDQIAYRQQMQGVKAYQKSKYPEAATIFKTGPQIDDLYNLGNAFAFQQKIPEAIDIYQQVLARDPKHTDAKLNKEYLERQLKKQQEQERQKQEEKRREQQHQEDLKKLLNLQELLNREQNLKKDELKQIQNELNKTPPETQPQSDPTLTQLKDQMERELPQKQQEQDLIDHIKKQSKPDQQKALEKLKKQIQQEYQDKQETIKNLPPTYPELRRQMEQENTLKTQELEMIDSVLQNQPQPSDLPKQPQSPDTPLSKPEQKARISPFDQDSQAILNHIKVPEYNVLRYRIQQQHKKYTGQ